MFDINEDINLFDIDSFELTPFEFDNRLCSKFSKAFTISHINIRSLNKNIDALRLLYEECIKSKFHLIGLSEVWNVSCADILGIDGYTLEVNCRDPGLRGGGVGVYVHSSLKYKMLKYDIDFAESLWLEVQIDDRSVVVGVIYRKPNTDIFQFQESLLSVLERIKVDKKLCILMGDFNIDLYNPSVNAEMLVTSLVCLGIHQLIKTLTRVTPMSGSLIDHIYTNMGADRICAGTIVTDVSDHFPIFAIFEDSSVKLQPQVEVRYRSYKNYKKEQFWDSLLLESWENVYECTDVNKAYDIFVQSFIGICDQYAPIVHRHSSRRKNDKPWLTRAIKKSIKKKHKLYGKVLKSNYSEDNLKKYRTYRNVLTTVLRNAKRKYYSDVFEMYKGDIAQTWKSINKLLKSGNSKVKTSHVDKLCVDENGSKKVVTSGKEISEGFNDFFVNVGPNLAKSINGNVDDVITFKGYLSDGIIDSMFWEPVTHYEVQDYLLTLNVKKACGFDDIPARLLKDAAEVIAKPLSYIYNQSLLNGVFPEAMKVAKVTPIFKKGDRNVPGNYRPISVLPLLAKIFEKLVNKRLLDYFERNDVLYKHQYGFRKHYSTKLSLINLVNDVLKSLDKGSVTLGVFLDFQKAFDTIDHAILAGKLEHYGIRGLPLQWFKDYLCNRFQFVNYDGHSSLKQIITCGVPQGSVLGPTLFLLYINDLPNSTNYFNFRLFADDSNLFHTFPPRQNSIDMDNIVNMHLDKVTIWCKVNKLTVNLLKTNYLLIRGSRQSVVTQGVLKIAETEIAQVDVASFVGIYIDQHLTWKPHIQRVNKFIRKRVGVLYRLRQFVPRRVLLLLYKTLIQPHMTYGIEVWGSNYEMNMKCLLLSQKMALRVITFSPIRTHSQPIFQELKLLNVYQLHKLSICVFYVSIIE